MKSAQGLFNEDLMVGNLGSTVFADSLRLQGARVIQADWAVPCSGDEELFSMLKYIRTGPQQAVDKANARVLDIMNQAHPFLVGVGKALDDIPDMREDLILHAGPPVEWDRMCGPMKGAVIGALIYEGRAGNEKQAERIATSGKITFEPCHHHSAVGPMAGVVSPSMPVWIVENRHAGNRAYCTLNEGLGKVLRYGAFSDEVVERLKWMGKVLGPVLAQALDSHGEIDLRALIAQALQMGDEGHNRNKAGTSLLIRELAPAIAGIDGRVEDKRDVLAFMHSNDLFS
jgi:hypothetical protein